MYGHKHSWTQIYSGTMTNYKLLRFVTHSYPAFTGGVIFYKLFQIFQSPLYRWAIKTDNSLVTYLCYRHRGNFRIFCSIHFYIFHPHVIQPIHQCMAIRTSRRCINLYHNMILAQNLLFRARNFVRLRRARALTQAYGPQNEDFVLNIPYKATPAATDTLKDSFCPFIGISTNRSIISYSE